MKCKEGVGGKKTKKSEKTLGTINVEIKYRIISRKKGKRHRQQLKLKYHNGNYL
jgi:hypothetical protein